MSEATGDWELDTNLSGSILTDSRKCVRQDLPTNISSAPSTLLEGTALTETSTASLHEIPQKRCNRMTTYRLAAVYCSGMHR